MQQAIRVATRLAVLGALVASASGCGGQDSPDPAGGAPPTAAPATTPAGEPGGGSFDFPEIKALVERSGQATFTAEYDATTPIGDVQATLVRQAPVTVRAERARRRPADRPGAGLGGGDG